MVTQRERYEEMIGASVERQAKCFIHLEEGFTVKEIAVILGVSVSRAYQIIQRGKARKAANESK